MVASMSKCVSVVVDVGEATRLLAVCVDRQGIPGERLTDEPGQNHPVGAGLARADGVEQTDDDHLGSVFLHVGRASASPNSFAIA